MKSQKIFSCFFVILTVPFSNMSFAKNSDLIKSLCTDKDAHDQEQSYPSTMRSKNGEIEIVGNQKHGEEERNLDLFSEISIDKMGVELCFAPTQKQQVVITAEENLLPFIQTEVKDKKLTITLKKSMKVNQPIRILLGTSQLEKILVEGSLILTGKQIQQKNLAVQLQGSAQIKVDGKVDSFRIDAKGSIDVATRKLQAQHVMVDIQGAGNVEVCAQKTITTSLEGTGHVDVYCHPSRSDKKDHSPSWLFPVQIK